MYSTMLDIHLLSHISVHPDTTACRAVLITDHKHTLRGPGLLIDLVVDQPPLLEERVDTAHATRV